MVAQGIPEIGAYIAFLFVSTVALVIVLRLFITPRTLDLLLKRRSHSNQAKSLPAPAGLDSSSSTIPTC